MKEAVKFSIIMPTYNRKHCIKNAIDSLLAQTYQEFELIIIDDGSSDDTGEYLKNIYKEEFGLGKIRYYFLEKNQGASFARNRGLAETKYNWIGYLDSDNKMRENFLDTFVNYIQENPNIYVFYAQLNCINSGKIVGEDFDFGKLLIGNYIDLGVFIHSANLYKEFGGFDNNLSRLIDWDLIIRYTERYKPFFIEKVILDYYDGKEFSRITNNDSHNKNYKRVVINYLSNMSPDAFYDKCKNIFNRDSRIRKENDEMKKEIEIKNREIKVKNKEIEIKNREIEIKNKEIDFIKSSKFWKLRNIYLKLKYYFTFIFLNPRKFLKKYLKV